MTNTPSKNEQLPPSSRGRTPPWLGKAIIYLGLAAVLLYTGTLLAPVWVLLFASVLVAVLLDGAASALRQRVFRNRLPSNQVLWVLVVIILFGGALTALGFLLGPSIAEQMKAISEQLPKAVEQLRAQVSQLLPATDGFLNRQALEQLMQPSSTAGKRIAQAFGSVAGALGSTAVVVVIGFYLALQPDAYTRGCVLLVPAQHVDRAQEALHATGKALQQWLIGRICSMGIVFLLTTLALWILGAPLALALGLLAGLLTFIPFFGPILSAVPAILLGLLESQLQALWILIAYVAVQFLEGNLVTPLAQAYAVSLKPAVLLGSQLVAGSLFGFPGVIIATPLAVAVTVLVQVLYIRHHLGKEDTVPLGEHSRSD